VGVREFADHLKDLAIVQCDIGKESFIAAYRLSDGQQVWRKSRDEIPSWGSPTIVETPQRVELVTNASKFARGYDPLTGDEFWKLGRHRRITVPSPIFGEGLISSRVVTARCNPIYAIKPGMSGDLTLKQGNMSNDAIAWSTTKVWTVHADADCVSWLPLHLFQRWESWPVRGEVR